MAKAKSKKKKSQDALHVSSRIAMGVSNGIVRLMLDIALYTVLIVITVILCKYAYNFTYQMFGDASVSPKNKPDDAYSMSVTIYEGESTMEIADRLENYGIILNKYSFATKCKLDKAAIKPGTFILSSDMDYSEILEIISDFDQVVDEDEIEEQSKPKE